MSIAGIRSNRGDGYQTLVAFDWALKVLTNPDYQWIEVDSTQIQVDDLVIGKSDGAQICCQCKKNQPDFKDWAIADLSDELHKAAALLAGNALAGVRFYSRSSFGPMAKLREHVNLHANETDYQSSLGKEHQKTDTELAKQIAIKAPTLSTYDFLRRTTFEVSPELDQMKERLEERLRYFVSNATTAYNALWTRLDQLGARMEGTNNTAASQHRLDKSDLISLLHGVGAMLVPPIDIAQVRAAFAKASTIGRSWHRDIKNQRLNNPVLGQLLSAIDAGQRSILLTGQPGSGKTCVMLALQDELELRAKVRSDLVPLFVQSREFADTATTQDRQAQGLPEQWVEKAARLAEVAQVVIVIDSLDVLSIAREHGVLKYFLAQIDQLLSTPRVTVVTACRDFDRRYDRQIAVRKWDTELQCQPLNWETQVAPLLESQSIETSNIDAPTRELIRNPRELSLFVELAQRKGSSFNVVTGQELAQRYLESVVQEDKTMGEVAMLAIEAIASEMLTSRSLAVPQQRFNAPKEIERALLSNNVLHQTEDGKLSFGHQTLLDVLVISHAVRKRQTLNDFIESLPPVPFVRPSIRSFVAQLAVGDRREFRKQLRAVLTGKAAFHIRRLVAESFAEQKPQDDDWPLLRELHGKHPEMFQSIYAMGGQIEWHHFWLKHLVPILKAKQDADGMFRHVNRVVQWQNDDAAGVLAFWTDVLTLNWVDTQQIAGQLNSRASEITPENAGLLLPLLNDLLQLQTPRHNSLGKAVAICINSGAADDEFLWRYITGKINDAVFSRHNWADQLRCRPNEFGDRSDNFLCTRMQKSTSLLDLALNSIEDWSNIRTPESGNASIDYWHGFLHKTSYEAHSNNRNKLMDNGQILLTAVEKALITQAKADSTWWHQNRERVCFSREGALRYFSILACTASPETNLSLIKRMLCDKTLLESSLSYELGNLMHTAFMHLDLTAQDAVLENILTLCKNPNQDKHQYTCTLKKQALLITTIPCHLRSHAAQTVMDEYESTLGAIIRQPDIRPSRGMVVAPFPYEVFLDVSDNGVMRLLKHYAGHVRNSFDDFLLGGEDQVGRQLHEAASRHPSRFMDLLTTHWAVIAECFRESIMEGVSTHLAYRFGNLQASSPWKPLEEPDANILAIKILDELEKHPTHWHHNRAASKALQACANVIHETHDAERLVALAAQFETQQEICSISGGTFNFLTQGINMVRGHIAEALMTLTIRLLAKEQLVPELLLVVLRRFAGDVDPAVRAVILQHLPDLQNHHSELGWEVFDIAMHDLEGLGEMAEPCLYYNYYDHFQQVSSRLARVKIEGKGKDLESWGRISSLAALSGKIDFPVWLDELKTVDATEAWRGAASVWTYRENIHKHRKQCLTGIEAGLNAGSIHAEVVATELIRLFENETPLISISTDLFRQCVHALQCEYPKTGIAIFDIHEWLTATSLLDPEQALEQLEIYLAYVTRTTRSIFDSDNHLPQLLTRLFSEAEEREESDEGNMLRRVVAVQDSLLGLNVDGIDSWLKAAERP